MMHPRNDSDGVKPKQSEKKIFQYHFVDHKIPYEPTWDRTWAFTVRSLTLKKESV